MQKIHTCKSLMYFFLLLSRLSWYKDGRAVHYDKTHLADQHGSLFMLRLKEITINDLGNYTCEAENSQGLARDHIELSGKNFQEKHPYSLIREDYVTFCLWAKSRAFNK